MEDFPIILHERPEHHRVSLAQAEPTSFLKTCSHRTGIKRRECIEDNLFTLGLYQVAQLDNCQIDKYLISALVERWRPETNTFHLPVGEMTPTLEDVSCILGLPVTGRTVSGYSDEDYSGTLELLLGVNADPDFENPHLCPWPRRRIRKPEGEYMHFSKYAIRLKWLRDQFRELDEENATLDQINYYTRAYCLDLFGSVLFPDLGEKSVPAMYLQFLENLRDPPRWNWGEAVLACLYSYLSRASLKEIASIGGPMLFLQFWSWNHISVGRPVCSGEVPALGGNVPARRPPLGVKWLGKHDYSNNPHGSGVAHYREKLDKLESHLVNWTPYQSYYAFLPQCCYDDFGSWICRRFVVHMWIVEYYHGDRVMRQFGLYQTCPPPPPVDYGSLKELREIVHSSGRGANEGVNWKNYHAYYIDYPVVQIAETRPYDSSERAEAFYIGWFYKRGMPKLYFTDNNPQALSQTMPPLDEPVESLGYVSHAQSSSRAVFRLMHQTAQAIVWLRTPGKRWFGLQNLLTFRDLMTDLGHVHIFRGMLMSAGIQFELEQIDVSSDYPDSMPQHTPMPQAPEPDIPFEEYAAFLSGNISSLNMDDPYGDPNASSSTPHAPYGDPNASSSTPYAPPHADRPRRDVHPAPRLSPSPFQRIVRNLRRR